VVRLAWWVAPYLDAVKFWSFYGVPVDLDHIRSFIARYGVIIEVD
jgi:hypothetical protein